MAPSARSSGANPNPDESNRTEPIPGESSRVETIPGDSMSGGPNPGEATAVDRFSECETEPEADSESERIRENAHAGHLTRLESHF